MTNCGLLDISSSSNEKDGLKAISIDPIINVGLVIAAFILVLFNIMGQGRGDYLLVRARLMTNVEDMMPGFVRLVNGIATDWPFTDYCRRSQSS
jgi:hypothetical protein